MNGDARLKGNLFARSLHSILMFASCLWIVPSQHYIVPSLQPAVQRMIRAS